MDFVELELAAQAWMAQDPDPKTVAQLQTLLKSALTDSDALAELQDSFRGPLEFGTAGLRGKLGAGPNRMNRITVQQTAAGLANYLIANNEIGKPVVIGFDARHNSDVFARDTALIFAGAGLTPMLFASYVPTPVLAYAIRELRACAGVMVTASHNPAQDNGYKVYLGDGRQIVSPADSLISSQIRLIDDLSVIVRSEEILEAPIDLVHSYVTRTSQLILNGPTTEAIRKNIKVVYTAMHGVGYGVTSEVIAKSGFNPLNVVIEQRDPDPDFSTAPFPNPEEPGALDLAIVLAQEVFADVLLANDPDADRLAVALIDQTGSWKSLHGDQVGMLLAWWIIERAERMGKKANGTVASSIVSSMMLEQLAHARGLGYENTLTGFKWVSRVPNLIYGYEEALGYCVDPIAVGDKDGISAAAMMLELISALKAVGRTCWDILDELAKEFGQHLTDQVSVRVSDLAQVDRVLSSLRQTPPATMGGLELSETIDLEKSDSGLPPTNGIIFYFGKRDQELFARVIVRPSGTEPKIKCYLEVVSRNPDKAIARTEANRIVAQLATDAAPLLIGK